MPKEVINGQLIVDGKLYSYHYFDSGEIEIHRMAEILIKGRYIWGNKQGVINCAKALITKHNNPGTVTEIFPDSMIE